MGVLLALAGTALVPTVGEAGVLNQLEGGRWELQSRGSAGGVERICVRDAGQIIQLRHAADSCDRRVVSDSASEVTVQYTCRGKGYGRTQVRRETSRLIQIETQGIAGGLPFVYAAEGRRVGDCGN